MNKGRGRRADRTQRTKTINEGINIDGVRKEQAEVSGRSEREVVPAGVT